MSAGFAHVQRFLRETAGLAVEDDKRFLLEDRLKPILSAARLTGLDDLACELHANRSSELAQAVVETMTIQETSFFRDGPMFKAMADRILPQLVGARDATRRLRIWCTGCSTGQEPYSVAMVVDNVVGQHAGWRVDLLATDLSRRAIEQARAGLYSAFEVQRGLGHKELSRFFRRRGEQWQVKSELRSKITFGTHNLLSGPAEGGPFDLVLCRNVLFYFDSTTRRQVLACLSEALAPDGFLVLGGAERIGDLCPALKQEPTLPFTFVRSADTLSVT